MKKHSPFFRAVRGDGNCFYRSLVYAYLEILLLKENNYRLFNSKLEEYINFVKRTENIE